MVAISISLKTLLVNELDRFTKDLIMNLLIQFNHLQLKITTLFKKQIKEKM